MSPTLVTAQVAAMSSGQLAALTYSQIQVLKPDIGTDQIGFLTHLTG